MLKAIKNIVSFLHSSSHSAAVTAPFKESNHHLDHPARRSRPTLSVAPFVKSRSQPLLRQGPSGLRVATPSFIRPAFKPPPSQLEPIILGNLIMRGLANSQFLCYTVVYPTKEKIIFSKNKTLCFALVKNAIK